MIRQHIQDKMSGVGSEDVIQGLEELGVTDCNKILEFREGAWRLLGSKSKGLWL
jgi:hypothetical protein